MELRGHGANGIQLTCLIRCNTSEAERAKKKRKRKESAKMTHHSAWSTVRVCASCQSSWKACSSWMHGFKDDPRSLVSVKESACRYTQRDGDGEVYLVCPSNWLSPWKPRKDSLNRSYVTDFTAPTLLWSALMRYFRRKFNFHASNYFPLLADRFSLEVVTIVTCALSD